MNFFYMYLNFESRLLSLVAYPRGSPVKVFTSMDQRAITADRVRLVDPVTEASLYESLHSLARRYVS